MTFQFDKKDCPFCEGKGFRTNFLGKKFECDHSFTIDRIRLTAERIDSLMEEIHKEQTTMNKMIELAQAKVEGRERPEAFKTLKLVKNTIKETKRKE